MKKTIDSPIVSTPKVELWLLMTSSASMTPDIIEQNTDRFLTPILVTTVHLEVQLLLHYILPVAGTSLCTYKQRA